jgi:alpha(1,3/1,4) fucosyltransferase
VTLYAALAIRTPEFHDDRVFDLDKVHLMRPSLLSMAALWMAAYREGSARDVRLLTADRVQREGIDPRQVLLIAYDWTPQSKALAARGARPVVLTSLEPPVIGWWLYTNLPWLSRRFGHVFMFGGARERVAPGVRFHQLLFPLLCPPPIVTPRKPWAERRFLIMVNSNKALPRLRDLPRWFDRPREVSVKRGVATLRYPPIGQDRYSERWQTMEYFSNRADFDLYGESWDRKHPAITPQQYQRTLRAFRGQAPEKFELLGGYRFALAYENSRFPGYVSEKIFDCLYAGTIPVYDGAPDVTDYVPPEAFIDATQFNSPADLERFLLSVSDGQAEAYLAAGQAFLHSGPHFERWCAESFARELIDILVSEAEAGV